MDPVAAAAVLEEARVQVARMEAAQLKEAASGGRDSSSTEGGELETGDGSCEAGPKSRPGQVEAVREPAARASPSHEQPCAVKREPAEPRSPAVLIKQEPEETPVKKEPELKPIKKEPEDKPIKREAEDMPIKNGPADEPMQPEQECLGPNVTKPHVHPESAPTLTSQTMPKPSKVAQTSTDTPQQPIAKRPALLEAAPVLSPSEQKKLAHAKAASARKKAGSKDTGDAYDAEEAPRKRKPGRPAGSKAKAQPGKKAAPKVNTPKPKAVPKLKGKGEPGDKEAPDGPSSSQDTQFYAREEVKPKAKSRAKAPKPSPKKKAKQEKKKREPATDPVEAEKKARKSRKSCAYKRAKAEKLALGFSVV